MDIGVVVYYDVLILELVFSVIWKLLVEVQSGNIYKVLHEPCSPFPPYLFIKPPPTYFELDWITVSSQFPNQLMSCMDRPCACIRDKLSHTFHS